MAEHYLTIGGTREARYWHEQADADAHWISNGQPGPSPTVVVTPAGLMVYGLRLPLRPGVARWLALRLVEGVGIYEAVFGGDGSNPTSGSTSSGHLTRTQAINREP
jgi:hypothetical protein